MALHQAPEGSENSLQEKAASEARHLGNSKWELSSDFSGNLKTKSVLLFSCLSSFYTFYLL